MTEANEGPKIYVDSDWKDEALREKEIIAEQEAEAKAPQQHPQDVSIFNVVNMIAMQAVAALGGMQTPEGEPLPANPDLARLHIDMLEVLQKKTSGNLTDDENMNLRTVLHELRMAYVQMMSQTVPRESVEPEPQP